MGRRWVCEGKRGCEGDGSVKVREGGKEMGV